MDLDIDPVHVWKNDSIEERIFSAALICLEGHYMQSPIMGPQSIAKVMSIVSKTLEKTHTIKDVRYVLVVGALSEPDATHSATNGAIIETSYQGIFGCGYGCAMQSLLPYAISMKSRLVCGLTLGFAQSLSI